ncbi:hypothetical protein XELAEV_18006023mg [Xenopus laevis]|uniref:BED-type domain-containing protein n=1 Tax=Xenopus laevis TaxID=8355 RepID=A0A974DZS3_XENLA|nr:hypothetical protein XELAEV_18006023mg [Xenopus laevis]
MAHARCMANSSACLLQTWLASLQPGCCTCLNAALFLLHSSWLPALLMLSLRLTDTRLTHELRNACPAVSNKCAPFCPPPVQVQSADLHLLQLTLTRRLPKNLVPGGSSLYTTTANYPKANTMSTPTPSNIRKKIKEGVYQLIDYSSKRKSDVWKSFGVIFTDENEQINGYVACKECQKVMVYDSHKTGTSSLRKHSCTLSLPRRATINNFFPRKNFRASTHQDKEKITRLAVKYVCKDIRSFESINGDGFYELAQGLVDIGACVGRVDVRTLLPDPTTVSRNTNKYADEVRQSLISELKKNLGKHGQGAITLDMWTDDYRKISYLCITPSSNDSYTLTSLKKKCLTNLQLKFHMHMLHKIAVFLHPKLKSLKLLNTDEDITNVLNEVRRLVAEIQDRVEEDREHHEVQLILENSNRPPAAAGPVAAAVPPSRKKKIHLKIYQMLRTLVPDEVQSYCDLKISNPKSSSSSSKSEDFNLLHWWGEHSPVFPCLAQLARFVLSIPATSTPSERDFSTAGFVLQERRTQLKPGTVDDILFLHSNLPRQAESETDNQV